MANGFGGFGGNMGGFTLPDFAQPDLSGIGAAVAKYEAEEAKKGATNQYEADVADFKTNEAKELGQGLGSLDLSEIIPNLPPEVIAQVIPQLPPQVIAQVIPQLPPQVIQQVIPQLPPQVVAQIEEPFLPDNGRGEPMENDIDVRDPAGTGSVIEDLYETDPYVNPYVEPYQEPYQEPYVEPEVETYQEPYVEPYQEPAGISTLPEYDPVDVVDYELPGEPPERDIDIHDPIGTGTVVEDLYETDPEVNPYIEPDAPIYDFDEDVFDVEEPYDTEPIDANKNWWELFGYDDEQTAIDSGDFTYDEEIDMWLPNEPVVIDDPVIEDPVIEDPVIEDPVIEDPWIPPILEDPVAPPPPEEYVPEEPMYTPPVTITNPSQENLINQQRQTYNSNLSNLVYRTPDIEIDEYVRPMSAAQFGSAPGSAEDVRTPVYKPEESTPAPTPTPAPGFIAMNQGGSLNLNNSSMNRGIGQLPPMQQQDKLTQLFQSSFRPRR